MELLILLTVMMMSFGLALVMMKATLDLLLRSMTSTRPATIERIRVRTAALPAEQLAA